DRIQVDSPWILGFLMSAAGVGSLVGTLYLARRNTVLGLGRVIVISSAVLGVGLCVFAYSRGLWLSSLMMLFTGFGAMVQMAACNTILQTIVDEKMRGRLMSFYTMAFMGTAPFG